MAEEDRSVFDLPTVDPTSTFKYGEFSEQVGDIFAPKVKKFNTLLVLIHGGYWRPEYDRVHLRPFAAALSELGYQVISLEYRRIPGNPDAMVADIDLAIILRRNPYTLIEIYKERNYQDPKIKQNAGSEILGVIANDSITSFGKEKSFEIDVTNKTPNEILEKINSIINNQKGGDIVDWLRLVEEKNEIGKFFDY